MTAGKPYLHHSKAKPATHYSAVKALPDRQNTGTRHPTSVLTYGRDVPSTHPTAKPVTLGRWLVRTYSHAGDVVLDPFAGGGSLAVAAREEERRVIAIEQDPVHFATLSERVNQCQLRKTKIG